MDTVGSRLRDARRRRGWSQLRLAAEAGLGHATVERLERGEAMSRVENLRAMARVLRVRVEWLLVGREPMVAHADLTLDAQWGSPDNPHSALLIGSGGPWRYDDGELVGDPEWVDADAMMEAARRG